VRVAVTGSSGRLGRALLEVLGSAPFTGPFGPLAWSRPAFDLDAPERFAALLDDARPEVVVHAAAWTDVDGCAREPDLADRRNGEATAALARACAERGLDLVIVSTNEVFAGDRTDRLGYTAHDAPHPANPYGASKRAGEVAAIAAYEARGATVAPYVQVDRIPREPQLAIVRTAWLYGPPGNDFPDRIVGAAERARAAGGPLRAVADEVGDPTSTQDLAEAIAELLGAGAFAGIHHCVNPGRVSRAAWARELLGRIGLSVPIEEVSADAWPRASRPPRWGVLEPTPTPSGEPMRGWLEALADDLPWRTRRWAAAR
jgi:dTDP-4-dehydrorhamnose reductase